MVRGHRKTGNRKVFESLQNQSTRACVTWTELPTPSLAETPWPSCAIDFSISACLHLFLCLLCLLYCNLSHYFISYPSQTQWEGYFCLQKPVFLKMALYIFPQSLKSTEFLSRPSRASHSLQLWNILPCLSTQLPPALLPTWGVQNRTSHSSWGLEEEGLLAMSYTIYSCLYTGTWLFFYIAWNCWFIFNSWPSRTSDPFLNWPGFQPHNLSCDACYFYQQHKHSSWAAP